MTLNPVDLEPEITVRESQLGIGKNTPPGIGGVLILIAVGLSLSGLQNLTYFLGSLAPIVRGSLWDRLTDPNSDAYHAYWKPFLVYQAVVSLCFLVANIFVLILFFRRSRIFPKLIVPLIPTMLLLGVVGHFWSGSIPAVSESAEYAKEGHELIVKFVGLHVWIPYFLLSKRVKETFVY